MLRDLPVRSPGELVEPRSRYPSDPAMNFFSWPSDFAGAATLADVAGATPSRLQVGADGVAETVDYVTGNLFGMLGVGPALGRLIGPDDDGGEAVVAIGWEFWRSRFDRDPGAIGRRIDVQGVPATVIGVAPRGSTGSTPTRAS